MHEVTASPAEVRCARRAYYGGISFVDDLVARLLAALAETGLDARTVVVFSSDHGDMLGERGMWLKKNFYEPALRVPLLFRAPWRFSPRRVEGLVSLLDLLPTFVELGAPPGKSGEFADRLDGRSLVPALESGVAPARPLHAEILCEGAVSPILMLRDERWKFVWSRADPPLLFDLESDPLELRNRAAEAVCKERIEAFTRRVFEVWEPDRLEQAVRQSQRRRRTILEAEKARGPASDWDHVPDLRPEQRWFRGRTGYNEWALDHVPIPRASCNTLSG